MNNIPVKKSFSCLLFVCFFALNSYSQQVKTYSSEWKKVDEYMEKSLPQSALDEVKKIYALAKKENQEAQVIKSLLYLSKLQQETREDNLPRSIADIEKETGASKEPAASILNSLLASLYYNYYSSHRWELYNRTNTVNFKKDDITTWGADDFHKKISELYLRSIKNEKLLQQTKLAPYDAIIRKGNARNLRPTLYDLLVHTALGYFENDERNISKPAYAFEIASAAAFDPAADFIHRSFPTPDSLSLEHKALLLYQQLIAFHINDPKPDALIDVDIQRIQFVQSKSVHPDKDKLYFNAINHIAHQYETLPAAAQAWFLMASYYEEKASTYAPYGDTTHRYDRIKAKEICEKIAAQKDSTQGIINCRQLLKDIGSRRLSFQVETVNLPNQPFRVNVNYRNFHSLYLRLVRPDDKLRKNLETTYDEAFWPAVIAAKSFKNWDQSLPVNTDFQSHSAEIKVDGLPPGEYLLVLSTEPNFNDKSSVLAAGRFYVSSISYINYKDDFFVLDRDSGKPLAGASVQTWIRKYDYNASRNVKTKSRLYKTDANGFFHLERIKIPSDENYSLDITYGNDHLFTNDESSSYYYYYGQPPLVINGDNVIESTTNTYLFTDRGIYRPGQTAYFKGITLATDNNGKKISRTDYKSRVYLRNVAYEAIDSMDITTNEYGSFSGKFVLPKGSLNGAFTIAMKDANGSATISVEEYKRPKFYVDYEPLKGTYQVNDSIKITGVAKAYAGNNIDGATVTYRVVRTPRFLYDWMYSKWWFPPSTPMEIAHGVTKTGKDGNFILSFKAIPDLKVDKKLDPVFDYQVFADITDINGETRSGSKTVSVGYKALQLAADIPARLPADSLQKFSIKTTNTNGEFEPAKLTVTITRLKEEKRLIRPRFWDRPDQFVMTKEEYLRYFPHDEYDNETDVKSWERGQQVFQRTDSAKATAGFELSGTKWESGFYVVEIFTKDKNGEEVKDVKYIELFDNNNAMPASPQYLWTKGSAPIEPGETTSVKLGTSADSVFLIHFVDKKTENKNWLTESIPFYSFYRLDKEKKNFEFNAGEVDRGGYGVSFAFVKNNRFFNYSEIIKVPWTNKNLTIEYASFRDKTLPGSEEKWKIKLKGYKNEKVAAEMLAGMYDASLDQFYPFDWSSPAIWPQYSNMQWWEITNNFGKINSDNKYKEEPNYDYRQKIYDRLIFGISGERGGRNYARALFAAPSLGADKEVSPMAGLFSYHQSDEASRTDKFHVEVAITPGGKEEENKTNQPALQVRKNFNETAFFFPELRTDSSGAIEFSFTLPEALTRWKFQALAHTKDLAFGYSSKEIVTQKQLMVQPNAPRFLREGDRMEFSAKIVNTTDKEITGQAEFQLFDAATHEPVDGRFKNVIPNQYFTIAAGQSEAVKFPIEIPYQYNSALTWRIVAKTDALSDGEEDMLPVLTNRTLVTETMPLSLRGAGTKKFSFDKLLQSGQSESLQNYSLTVEYTSNPVWYAVQALPYLMEYPYECAEQTWNRYYANSLATLIANSSPRIKAVFEQWKNLDSAALLSALQKNEELKSILLEETPWVVAAKTEAQQKRNIALLFDMVKMSGELTSSYEKLKQMQTANGGFVWFEGGPDDRYITQYIVSGIGHLYKMKGVANGQEERLKTILESAIGYLDNKIKEDYDDLVKSKVDLNKYTPGYTIVQYLYMRSFFPEQKIPAATQKAYTYFRSRAQKTWTEQNKYMQGMIALALYRSNDATTASAILKSLKETSINNEELGMYWLDASRNWFWHQAPIERQALLIEAFQEAGKDSKTADDLRTWLLRHKQTNSWESTKATAEACYALLLQGTNWSVNEAAVELKLGNTVISSATNTTEAGTGYFKKTIEAEKINPGMGAITLTVTPAAGQSNSGQSSWGAVYWQYFEDLDKITVASTPLSIVKKLFIEKNSDRGPVLVPINDGDAIKVGDKVKVRIELRVDRDMEYVHMKDMRASALEPVNVLSGYKWQDGLGYYESTKDASTNFFISYLRKGTYVFEYPLFVTHTGNFSNGITSIQCMYAPEFSAHSEGVRINVE